MIAATLRARPLPARPDIEGARPAGRRAPFARVEIMTDFESARPAWAEIRAHAIASPYQSFEFAFHWHKTFGAPRGVRTWIVAARDEAGALCALLPLGQVRRGPLHIAAFLGGRLANFHMGLFRAGVDWTPADVAALLREAAALARPRIDAFTFANQPVVWGGAANPLAGLAHQPSPSFAYASALPDSFALWRDAHFSKSTKKKLRKKAQRLEAFGPLAHRRAGDAEASREIIEALLTQKRARMRTLGLPDEFGGERTLALLTELSTRTRADAEAPILELHALSAGTRIIATFAGVADAGRLSGLFLSHDGDREVAASSPGELLIAEIVRDAIDRGFVGFDLGVGEARYKNECCEITVALFDSAFGISPLGRLAAAAFLFGRRLKQRVKRSKRLYRLAVRARSLLAEHGLA